MRAKEYLLQIIKLDKMIQNKTIEKEQWMTMAMSTTAASNGERVQSSGSQQKMADAVIRYVELDQQIDRYIDSLIDTKQDVIMTIEKLPATEYDILHMVYIQGKDLHEVADKYDKTYSWATTVHGRALKNVQMILDKER